MLHARLEQHAQQLHGGADAARPFPLRRRLRAVLRRHGLALGHGRQQARTEPSVRHAARHASAMGQRVRVRRRLGRHIEQGVVAQHAVARQVEPLGLALPPGRNRADDRR